MKNLEIISLMDKFITGADTSLELANRLELLIDEAYPDDDSLQEIVEMLACYRPEGGEYLLNAEQIQDRLVHVKEYLIGMDKNSH